VGGGPPHRRSPPAQSANPRDTAVVAAARRPPCSRGSRARLTRSTMSQKRPRHSDSRNARLPPAQRLASRRCSWLGPPACWRPAAGSTHTRCTGIPAEARGDASFCVINDQPVGNPKRKVWWV
jgi:hypothetical protein